MRSRRFRPSARRRPRSDGSRPGRTSSAPGSGHRPGHPDAGAHPAGCARRGRRRSGRGRAPDTHRGSRRHRGPGRPRSARAGSTAPARPPGPPECRKGNEDDAAALRRAPAAGCAATRTARRCRRVSPANSSDTGMPGTADGRPGTVRCASRARTPRRSSARARRHHGASGSARRPRRRAFRSHARPRRQCRPGGYGSRRSCRPAPGTRRARPVLRMRRCPARPGARRPRPVRHSSRPAWAPWQGVSNRPGPRRAG